MTTRWNESDIQTLLRQRYRQPEWAYFEKVADGTGAHGTRIADGLAMNMYPSQGLELHGFEIKVSRSDWLKELRDAGKADSVARYCDRWWIVTTPDIVKRDELPPTWGLMEVNKAGDGLRFVKRGERIQANAIDRPFVASLLRHAARMVETAERASPVKAAVDAAEAAGFDRGHKAGVKAAERDRAVSEQLAYDLKKLRQHISRFERETGLQFMTSRFGLGEYPAGLANAVKAVMDGTCDSAAAVARDVREQLAPLIERLEAIERCGKPEPDQCPAT